MYLLLLIWNSVCFLGSLFLFTHCRPCFPLSHLAPPLGAWESPAGGDLQSIHEHPLMCTCGALEFRERLLPSKPFETWIRSCDGTWWWSSDGSIFHHLSLTILFMCSESLYMCVTAWHSKNNLSFHKYVLYLYFFHFKTRHMALTFSLVIFQDSLTVL